MSDDTKTEFLNGHRSRMKEIGDQDLESTTNLATIQSRMIFITAAGKIPGVVKPEGQKVINKLAEEL